jgi:hypothetical protein
VDGKMIVTTILSSSAVSAIVAALWGLGIKIWLQRREDASKATLVSLEAEFKVSLAEIEADLRSSQNLLQAKIDRSIFVTNAHFDTEFAAMKQVFSRLSRVRSTLYDLRPTSAYEPIGEDDNQKMERLSRRLQSLLLAHDALRKVLEAKRPFYPETLYVTATECLDAAQNDARKVQSTDLNSLDAWFLELTANRTRFAQGYRRAANIIRDRISTLAIIPRS